VILKNMPKSWTYPKRF